MIDFHGSDLEGILNLSEGASGSIVNGGSESADGCLWVWGSEEQPFTGSVTFASAACIKFCGFYFNGTIHITGPSLGGFVGGSHLLSDAVIQIDGDVVGPIGTVHVGEAAVGEIHVGGSVASGAFIDVGGHLQGEIAVGELVGTLSIGGNLTSTGSILVEGDIAGDVTIDGDVEGQILANSSGAGEGEITGDVTLDGEFNGNICGDNLSPMEDLPENISIVDFGDEGLICGARPWCGDGTISSSDPEEGTHDARQPHPPSDCSLGARQGIGSEDEPIVITLSEGGANNLACWELCETGIEDVDTGQGCSTLSANAIKTLTETSTGVYEIVLERPISAGHWTTVSYLGDDTYVTYASLPADANGDEYSGATDMLAHINCCLNQQCTPPYGDYSCDIDHSGAVGAADYLRLIDLLNGADTFIVWYAETLPDNTCPGEGRGMGSGGSGSAEEENAKFIDGVVGYMTTVTIADSEEETEFNMIVDALIGFCVDHLSADERKTLAAKLQDPSLKFASEVAAEAVPEIVEALLE